MKTLKIKQGFSLVEMLIVVAVIAILSALSYPVLSGLGEKSKAAACVSHLRNCGAVLLRIAAENNNQLQIHGGGSGGDNAKLWATQVAAAVVPDFDPQAERNNLKREYRELDMLYCPAYAPYRCDLGTTPWNWKTYGMVLTGEHWSSENVKQSPSQTSNWTQYSLHLARVEKPSQAPLLMDSVTPSEKVQRMTIRAQNAGNTIPSVHMRHGNAANAVFLDGHVEALDKGGLKNAGFTSAINNDLEITNLQD